MAAKTRLAARQTQMLPPACGLVSLFFFCVSTGAGLAGVVAKGATAAAAVAVVAVVAATSTTAWFAVLAAALAEITATFCGGVTKSDRDTCQLPALMRIYFTGPCLKKKHM